MTQLQSRGISDLGPVGKSIAKSRKTLSTERIIDRAAETTTFQAPARSGGQVPGKEVSD